MTRITRIKKAESSPDRVLFWILITVLAFLIRVIRG